jgi:uncharacterized protein
MAVPPRLSLVTLGVADVATARAFYEALGWRPSSASVEEAAFFPLAGCVLALHPRPMLAADAGLGDGDSGRFGGITLAMNLDSEADVDAAVAAMAAAGGTVLVQPSPTEWGGYHGYVADPDGHPWEVIHNPGFPLDEAGRIVLPD